MTTQKEVLIKSPLDDLSSRYLVEKDNILDIPERHVLTLLPAGISHTDRKTGVHRQAVLSGLFALAAQRGLEGREYPLAGLLDHRILLEPEPSNPYDNGAVRIDIEIPHTTQAIRGILGAPNGETNQLINIGYIPKAISRPIHKNVEMIKEGKILSLVSEVHKKFYSVRLELSYNPVLEQTEAEIDLQRFIDILT